MNKINLQEIKQKIKIDKNMKKRLIIISLVSVVVIIILARTTSNIKAVFFKKKAVAGAKGPGVGFEETSPIKAFKVKKMDFKDTLPCIGNIKGFKEVDLKFQVAGVLESFNFEEGEKVQEGDIIASLVQRDALLKLKYSEVELNKSQKLFDLGALNAMKLEQVKLEYESAKSDLDKTNIYAMSNGLLGSRLIDVGTYITPNDKVGVFVDIEKVFAEFSIIEKDVPKVALGQKAEVFVDSYPNKSYAGTVDRIAPMIEGRSRAETIKIELDNKEGLLRPGMFVRALIATYEKKDAVIIPASSLKKKDADYFVYVVHKEEPKAEPKETKPAKERKKGGGLFGKLGKKKEEPKQEAKPKEPEEEFGTVEIRKIKLGYMTQDLVEVEEGLKEEELIIKEIQEELKDKARVEITEVEEGLA